MSARLLDLIADNRIVVCVGSGGVGKTTAAATVALQAAIDGRKTLVLTIDPARRLANSLGLAELDNAERRIADEVFAAAGITPKGELWGMMLDVKRTFDELIRRIAPSDDAAERILGNHYYQNLSDALAGSQEYMAMEKLYELQAERDYDLIVVDTPPTKHALDFLEAPNRMADFLNGKVIQWFIKPYLMAGRVGFAFAQRSAAIVFKIMERATGYQAMADLADFFLAFDGMYEGFKERAGQVKRLLGSERTAFLLVSSPNRMSMEEAAVFFARLTRDRMTPRAIILNRVHEWPYQNTQWADQARLAGEKVMKRFPQHAPAIDALIGNALEMAAIARADDTRIADFVGRLRSPVPIFRVPALERDVHDVAALLRVGEHLQAAHS